MPLPATDAFTGADLDPLSADWTVDAGSFVILMNSAKGNLNNDFSRAFWDADVFDDDQYSEADYANAVADDFAGLVVRASAGNGIALHIFQGSWYAWDVSAGFDTNNPFGSAAVGDGDRIRLEVIGDTAHAYLNGAEVGTGVNVTGWASSGAPGIQIYEDAGAALDNWEGGNMAAAPPPSVGPPLHRGGFAPWH